MSLVQGYSSDSDSDEELHSIPVLPKDSKYNIVTVPNVDISTHELVPIDNVQITSTKETSNFGGGIERNYYDDATWKLQSIKSKRKLENSSKQESKKLRKKRRKQGDPEDIDYLGPWADYKASSESDASISGVDKSDTDEDANEGDEEVDQDANNEEAEPEVFTEFFGLKEKDYLGRTYMHVPRDLNVSLTNEPGSQECFVPKKIIHTFEGHAKGINKLEFFPKSGHLLLSCGNDSKIMLWDVYHKRELLRAYYGHRLAVKDVTFNSTGKKFLSCSFDKKIILWDTETGDIEKTIKLKAIPNVIKFNPNNENEFIVGLTNHKIEHYDLSDSNFEIPIQTYDHHLGAINSLTTIDNNNRFMSTSDDKTVRFWDWQINIPIKFISDPSQHSMPSAAIYPGGKYIALQSMDNSIQVIQGHGKFKFNKNKWFDGHNVAGYGIDVEISPDGKIIMSGDSKGFGYFWDWKTCKLVNKLKVSDKPITCIKSHPQEASKVAMAGINGHIYYCD